MKNDIQKLLESFGENSRIGDVLHAYEMHLSQCSIPASMVHAQKYYDGQNATRLKIIKLWSYSDLTKSLNSILSEAEWEEVKNCKRCDDWYLPEPEPHDCEKEIVKLVPKQPHIRELFQFLLQLNLAE